MHDELDFVFIGGQERGQMICIHPPMYEIFAVLDIFIKFIEYLKRILEDRGIISFSDNIFEF